MKCCTSYKPMHNGFPRQHTFYGEKKHICYTSNNIQNPNGCWNLLQALGVRVTLKAAVTFGVRRVTTNTDQWQAIIETREEETPKSVLIQH